jgi:hypothetical protein
MEKTYIVTGRHRTGTSMMMRCLDLSSDLLAEYDKTSDILVAKNHVDENNYHPNPNGYYLHRANAFPQDIKGGLIKLSLRSADWLRTEPGDYEVIWMIRDEKEREISWEKAFGKKESLDLIAVYEFYELKLLDRTDCKITFVNYADVVQTPLVVFEHLKEQGWPIDPVKAASFVDPELYRNKFAG